MNHVRFCLVTTFFPPYHFGGDAIHVAQLANLLAGAGHVVDVIHCVDSFSILGGKQSPSPFRLHPGVRVHAIRSRWGRLSPLLTYLTGQPWGKKSTLQTVLSQPIDVTHWHNVSLVGGPGALAMGRGVRLWTMHDYWAVCPAHILFRSKKEPCTGGGPCCLCLLRWKRLPPPWRFTNLLRDGLQYVDRVLVPSQFARDLLVRLGLPGEPLVLRNFLPETELAERSGNMRPYYLYAGRLVDAKGLDRVLPVFRQAGLRLIIAGSGEQERQLRRLAGGSSTIVFIGRVEHQQLPSLYRNARATIIPSICPEVGSLVMLESLAQSTPVVASSEGALPELIEITGGGWVYQNPEQLRSIILQLEQHPEEAERRGREGRKNLGTFSSWEYMRRYLEIIQEVREEHARKLIPVASSGPARQ